MFLSELHILQKLRVATWTDGTLEIQTSRIIELTLHVHVSLDGGFLQTVPVVLPGLVVSRVVLGLSHGLSRCLKQVDLVNGSQSQNPLKGIILTMTTFQFLRRLELDHLSLALLLSSQLEVLGPLDRTLKG